MYKILVVEDDETIVQIVKRHLQSWGYEVFQVEDFAHVIQEFVQKDPQLVLLECLQDIQGNIQVEMKRAAEQPMLVQNSYVGKMIETVQ